MEVKKFAVIGNPIEHSKSPIIHKAFAEQPKIIARLPYTVDYQKIFAPLDGFAETVQNLMKEGYIGANVTVPFKFEAYQLSQHLSTRAQANGEAVNTLRFIDGQIHGDNTDGAGLRNDIECNLGFEIPGKNILILGAGGAAHGVLMSLIGANSITIANRTLGKALKMITGLYHDYNMRAVEYESLNVHYDLIVNATSAGLTDSALPLPNCIFSANSLAYDMMYGRETPFMAQARANGATVADGLGMLVEQAAEAFSIWHGVQPDTAPVLAMLRKNNG
jgi:shikimate dehydrogenase